MHQRLFSVFTLFLLTSAWSIAHDPGLGSLEAVSSPSGRIDLTLTLAQHDLRLALAARQALPSGSAEKDADLSEGQLRKLAYDLIRLESRQSDPPPPPLRLESVRAVSSDDRRHAVYRFSIDAAPGSPLVLEVPLLNDFPRGYRLHVTAVDAEGQERAALLDAANNRFLLTQPSAKAGKTGGWPAPDWQIESASSSYNYLLFLPALMVIGLLVLRGWRPEG
ncbi:MAG TPA: hypothetical protein VLV83_04310 [Acidobacteriota bacterium]|nr:hypothetical protein [Acidobacteriota bacterium]